MMQISKCLSGAAAVWLAAGLAWGQNEGGASADDALPKVVSFTLIDASTNEPVPEFDPVPEGAVIDIGKIPGKVINFRANTNPDRDFGSVRFQFSGASSASIIESMYVWAAFGDKEGKYNARTLKAGSYALTATPYTGNNAQGDLGEPLTLNFSITDSNPSAPTATETYNFPPKKPLAPSPSPTPAPRKSQKESIGFLYGQDETEE